MNERRLPRYLVLIGIFAVLVQPGTALAAQDASRNPEIERLENVAVPMRDGVVLRADILKPPGPGRFPTLVYRTPYGRKEAQRSSIFAKAVARGYTVVAQDVRGRYGSDGEYDAYRREGRDGYDTIEWAAKQSWSNGAVGTFGLSYPGAVQWLAAMEQPPSLKTMVPAMTFSTPRNFFYSGGVFDLSWIAWIWNNIAPDIRARKNLPGPRTEEEVEAAWKRERERVLNHLPLSSLPDLREVTPFYYEWMRHPPYDPWWDWAELRGKYGRVSAAVLNLSGWHDEAYGPEGATTNFMGLVEARKGDRSARTKLVMGPWSHGTAGMRNQRRVGERDMTEAAFIDYDELILRWMDRYVRGLENGVEREKPVRSFLMGANVWREYDAWPPPSRLVTFYLASGEGRGRLATKADERAGESTFTSDPAKPLADPFAGASGAHDYRELADRKDVAVFDSKPFAEDTEVTGALEAIIHLSADAPDTDLWVKIFDVAPDGTAFNLMSPGLDVVRASYRSRSPQRELLEPDKVYELRFPHLMTSNLFKKGHLLRVLLSTSFFPHFSRNLHTGRLETESAEMRPARITIHHGGKHPSRIVLPVIGR